MENKIFLDTNIILDFIIPDRANYQLAKQSFQKVVEQNYEVFISEDIISTTYYIAKGYREECIAFFQGALEFWKIVSFGNSVLKKSFDFSLKHKTDLVDTLQCFCAKENGCIFLTGDKKFVDCGVKMVTYDEFLGN